MKKNSILLMACLGEFVFDVSAQTNYLAGWDGKGTTTDEPDAFEWDVTEKAANWYTAGATPDCYRDNLSTQTNPASSRCLYAQGGANVYFSYRINDLQGGKIYQFSGSNRRRNGQGQDSEVTFATAKGDSRILSSQTKLCNSNPNYQNYSFNVYAPTTGTYYLIRNSANSKDVNGSSSLSLIERGDTAIVTFDTDGGSTVAIQYFLTGESYTVSQPQDPIKNGYTFAGWYANPESTRDFDFFTPVTTSKTVYPKWGKHFFHLQASGNRQWSCESNIL